MKSLRKKCSALFFVCLGFYVFYISNKRKTFNMSADNDGVKLKLRNIVKNVTTPVSLDQDSGNILKHKCINEPYDVLANTSENTHVVYDNDVVRAKVSKLNTDRVKAANFNGSCVQRFPKCLIIGAAKAGTEELRDFMRLHPSVSAADVEIYYFGGNYHRGVEWYRSQMPCSYTDQITVEKTPNYFVNPRVAERVYKFDKNMKFILIVREPVEIIISVLNYINFPKNKRINTNISRKFSFLSSMPDFDNLLIEKTNGEVKNTSLVVVNTLYDVHIKRYLQYFGRNQILVVDANELKTDPVAAMAKVETFLGLDHQICSSDFVFVEEKEHFCIKTQNISCYSMNRGRTVRKDLLPETKTKLKDFFKDHNQKFFDLIGQQFNW